MNEADTCRKLVRPKILAAGWDSPPHEYAEQAYFTDGRIVVAGPKVRRRPRKYADFLLRYRRDFTLGVVEAKSDTKPAGSGMQQAKDYADILGLKFAFATNGREILEFDAFTGLEREREDFPTPAELWQRYRAGMKLPDDAAEKLLTPSHHRPGLAERYYQQTAVNRTVQAILTGRRRCLLTMATGTGKTAVAFQVCWKLWSARWNRAGEPRRPRILYLADRTVLVNDPKDKTFAPFGDARHKIENGQAVKSRELYFATYQALARDEARPGLYREYDPDFFDLVIVDECHRGSADEEGNWREILTYFAPAFQLGMTATPKHTDNADTYAYFGEPLYTYRLRQGIDDGFLAPYRVHRVVTTVDAAGWRPSAGEVDRYGRAIPDAEYHTKEFEREVALRQRTRAIARHLTDFLKSTNRFAKTIVFCVDQEHADEMRRELNNRNADLVRDHPDYVCRVTADEGKIGAGHLSRFQELETLTPVILTTSQMLTTGVDAPTCTNVVLARVIGSMTDFKQIIGRGTRVREDYGKLFFNILDYTGSATRLFADPDFDGDPIIETSQAMDDQGATVPGSEEVERSDDDPPDDEPPPDGGPPGGDDGGGGGGPRKYYVDGGVVEIAAHLVYELDADGKQLRVVQFTDYAAEKVRTLFPTADELRRQWADPAHRSEIVARLEDRGVSFDELAKTAGRPDDDPFDLLCHFAYNAPLRTRRERAERLRKDRQDFFDRYGPQARAVLEELLEKYSEHGADQLVLPAALKVPPLSERGTVLELANLFGGGDKLRQAVAELQELLYAA